jgi:hypothetical protein
MNSLTQHHHPKAHRRLAVLLAVCTLALQGGAARASIAYGTINNFDTVNDTGGVCHGFEIELDDVPSRNITYCYSWNHYGTPSIREDTTSVPGHTNVFVRYAAVLTNGAWSAYTAIPSGPIAPTRGIRLPTQARTSAASTLASAMPECRPTSKEREGSLHRCH